MKALICESIPESGTLSLNEWLSSVAISIPSVKPLLPHLEIYPAPPLVRIGDSLRHPSPSPPEKHCPSKSWAEALKMPFMSAESGQMLLLGLLAMSQSYPWLFRYSIRRATVPAVIGVATDTLISLNSSRSDQNFHFVCRLHRDDC